MSLALNELITQIVHRLLITLIGFTFCLLTFFGILHPCSSPILSRFLYRLRFFHIRFALSLQCGTLLLQLLLLLQYILTRITYRLTISKTLHAYLLKGIVYRADSLLALIILVRHRQLRIIDTRTLFLVLLLLLTITIHQHGHSSIGTISSCTNRHSWHFLWCYRLFCSRCLRLTIGCQNVISSFAKTFICAVCTLLNFIRVVVVCFALFRIA